MELDFDAVFYEPMTLDYPLCKELKVTYGHLDWIEIESHNRIPELSAQPNSNFTKLKRHLIIGIRKTHKHVPNQKVSDWLVPYTSSGCRAMCLYCYLVCNYNKCSYLRLFVNREQMFERILKAERNTLNLQTFEIGSNSDLVLENVITNNLCWTIERFAAEGRGFITFPTKFDMVEPLLSLDHAGKTIFRMSVNPQRIIRQVEIGTSPLEKRIAALNAMAEADYRVGMLIAPVILIDDWKNEYRVLIEQLADSLSNKVKQAGFIEIILMTYSYVHDAINSDAFPMSPAIFDRSLMTGRGRGKYCYRADVRAEAEAYLTDLLTKNLPEMRILYIS